MTTPNTQQIMESLENELECLEAVLEAYNSEDYELTHESHKSHCKAIQRRSEVMAELNYYSGGGYAFDIAKSKVDLKEIKQNIETEVKYVYSSVKNKINELFK